MNDLENTSDDEIQSSYDPEGADTFYTPKAQPIGQFSDKTIPLKSKNKEISAQSVTSSELVEEFGKQIDLNFRNTDSFVFNEQSYNLNHNYKNEM